MKIPFLIVILILFVIPFLPAQEPPVPPVPPVPGRQYPYITTDTQKRTNVVTTVFEIKFLRIIEAGETNRVPIRTNIISMNVTNL